MFKMGDAVYLNWGVTEGAFGDPVAQSDRTLTGRGFEAEVAGIPRDHR